MNNTLNTLNKLDTGKKERFLKAYSGTGYLVYNDEAEFEIHRILNGAKKVDNITCILDEAYCPDIDSKVLVHTKIMKDGKLLFDEDGRLEKKIDKDGILSYFICGNNLDYLLFYNTDEFLDISIRVRVREDNKV